jgi:hypothetical protein
MLTAEAAVDAVSSPATPREFREWYDPDSVVFQAIEEPEGQAVADDDDEAIDMMKAAGIAAR